MDFSQSVHALFITAVLIFAAACFWRRRFSAADGLLTARVFLEKGNPPEARRDLARSLRAGAVSLRSGGGLRRLAEGDALPEIDGLELLGAGGVAGVLERAGVPGNFYQPHYVLGAGVQVYGFVRGPVRGDRPENKFTPWAVFVNFPGGDSAVTVTVTPANGAEKSIDLVSYFFQAQFFSLCLTSFPRSAR